MKFQSLLSTPAPRLAQWLHAQARTCLLAACVACLFGLSGSVLEGYQVLGLPAGVAVARVGLLAAVAYLAAFALLRAAAWIAGRDRPLR